MNWLEVFLENFTLIATLYAANYVLAGLCAIREVMNSRTAQASIAWLLSLGLLPFPTTFVYLVIGWKHFDSYAEIQTHSGRDQREKRAAELELIDNEAQRNWPVLHRVAEVPFLRGNKTELLIDGDAAFASMLDGIARARSYILVQFYIVRDDDLGNRFADALIERARAGVKVYFLYDDAGSFWLSRSYKRRLREAGVALVSFNHRHRFLRIYGPTRINYRNHRKILVADGLEAWVGGLNVGDEYLGLDPKIGPWRDTHVHVRGPAAQACGLVFREDWAWSTGEELPAAVPEDLGEVGDQSVLVMPTGPADPLEDCAIAFAEVIARARKRLWIVSPYFVPARDIQTALYAASMRGVDVKILLPEKPDHMLVWLASMAHADIMAAHNIEVFRYREGFLHQKVILCDDELAGVGTVNFDYRSFNINFEITLWFTGREMVDNVKDMLERDFAKSLLTTQDELQERNFFFRLACQTAKLFSPVL
ncbi:cardiolipin synthase [Cucumibacter marinus]|uniref:cardiolipin synthase n=1 Tax=Cucumibacter marinus TaxID=1121252 RepID=UPI0003FDFCA8|nr:cardiolipin synthase [Cucumibacter marinus]